MENIVKILLITDLMEFHHNLMQYIDIYIYIYVYLYKIYK